MLVIEAAKCKELSLEDSHTLLEGLEMVVGDVVKVNNHYRFSEYKDEYPVGGILRMPCEEFEQKIKTNKLIDNSDSLYRWARRNVLLASWESEPC